MAHVIPVNGEIGPSMPLFDAMDQAFERNDQPRPIHSQPRLDDPEQVVLSYLDATEVNEVASRLVGASVWGNAVLLHDRERFE